MTIPNAAEMQLGILAESSWGVLPSPATFTPIRVTGESIDVRRENVVSQEIRADRNVPDLIQVGGGAGGGINLELSYDTFDALLQAALFSTWTGSPATTMVNGVTPKSFHIQKKFEGGGTDQYFLYTGMMVDTFDLNIRAKQIVTGSVNFIGKGGTLSQAATGTTGSVNTKAVMDAGTGLALTRVAISPAPTLLGCTIRISNKLREQPQCAAIVAAGVGAGRCEVSGSFEAYFTSKTIADMYLAGTAGSLNLTIGTVTAEKYTINIPNLKISNAKINAGGNDQDVVISCDWQGLYNTGIAGTIQILKAVA